MVSFENKRVLVTGAGSGIGRSIALRIAENGGHVIAVSRTKEHLASLAAECESIQTICLDLVDFKAVETVIKSALPIDLLVNNAGMSVLNPVVNVPLEEFDDIYSLNVKTAILISQIVARNMIERGVKGSIVNLSSTAGQRPLLNHLSYCTSKAALDMVTKCCALEWGPKGIRVNAVSPTVVMTEMGKMAWSEPTKKAEMVAKIPQGRFVEVDEVVDAVVFLLSERSSMINGHLLPVDGGLLAS